MNESKVFTHMIQAVSNMSTVGVVKVEGLSATAMEFYIEWLNWENDAEKFSDFTDELSAFADKYFIPNLKVR